MASDGILKVQLLDTKARLPVKQYAGDAGFDLFVLRKTVWQPGQVVDVPTGIAIEIPDGHWARIVGRSSTIRKRGLLVVEGIIDNGWRGHLFFAVLNPTNEVQEVKAGERLAQLIVHRLYSPGVEMVAELSESDRGVQGFGSTGL
jgi:dUTP pyrophosphatase